MKIDCKSDFAFHSADFCSLLEESELGARSFVCGAESLECPLCRHIQGTCAPPSSADAAPRDWEALSLSSLCVSRSCRLPAVCASQGTSFPSLCCPQPAAGSSSVEVPALSSPAQQSSAAEAEQGTALGTGHLQSSTPVERLPNFCQVTAPPSVPGSVPGSTTLCAALLAPGSTEVLWRAESREKLY